MSDETTAKPFRLRPCAICGKLAVEAFKPFCSKRCADVDLNRWLKGVYAIPVTEDNEKPEDDEEGRREG
jgi:uncharacterized protein